MLKQRQGASPFYLSLQSSHLRLRNRIAAPTFHRHDKVNGKRFTEPVDVEFPDVQIKTGQD